MPIIRRIGMPVVRPIAWAVNEAYRPAGPIGPIVPTPALDLDLTASLDNRVTFTRASGGTRVNEQGLIETVAADTPRFDHDPVTGESLGLLIEGARTNTVRNSTMQGAVAGTPGTLPTNWAANASVFEGITRTVVALPFVNGIQCIDIRFEGTATGTSSNSVFFEQSTSTAALQNQTWTGSFYASVVGGSLSGLSGNVIRARVLERNSSGVYLDETTTVYTSASLTNLTRTAGTRTLANSTVAFVQSGFAFLPASVGAVIDFTIRIGAPQIELGPFASSYIPTTSSQVTRAADVAVMTGANFSDWYNQSEGTFFVDASGALVSAGARNYIEVSGTGGNRQVLSATTAGRTRYLVTTNNVTQASLLSAVNAIGAGYVKMAASYRANDFQTATNGVLSAAGTTGEPPAVNQMIIGRDVFASDPAYLYGHIKRLTYWNVSLPETLQQLTTLTE
jgi:hypothetical protein